MIEAPGIRRQRFPLEQEPSAVYSPCVQNADLPYRIRSRRSSLRSVTQSGGLRREWRLVSAPECAP
eukprot:scaffold88703_cov59-Phaeocystis_antarctica.AAC.3